MLESAPVTTPMTHTSRLSPNQCSPLDADATSQYRILLGRLIYLTNTRPDIAFVVHNLSQFIFAPTTHHQQAVSRLLRYFKGTPSEGLYFSHTSSLHLYGYGDSDCETCPTTHKFVTGYSIYLGDTLISWKSKKQPTISRISSEVEYRALATTTCELQWLSYLLQDLHLPLSHPATLYCGKKSALEIASNQVFHEHTKHIEIDYHLVREKT